MMKCGICDEPIDPIRPYHTCSTRNEDAFKAKIKFTPEDFIINERIDPYFIVLEGATRERLAEIANAKLDAWLKGAPTVYFKTFEGDESYFDYWQEDEYMDKFPRERSDKQAKLVCIEKIEK